MPRSTPKMSPWFPSTHSSVVTSQSGPKPVNTGVAEVTGDAIQTADEVVLMQGHSKTDPNGQVSIANAFEAPGSAFCLVGLFKHAQRLNPSLFANSENFLLTLSNGKVLHRDVMTKNLSRACPQRTSSGVGGGPPAAAISTSGRATTVAGMWPRGCSGRRSR